MFPWQIGIQSSHEIWLSSAEIVLSNSFWYASCCCLKSCQHFPL